MSTESPVENKKLVSIICRTLGRPELQQALQSINSQDYPNIETVLVDAAGDCSLDTSALGDRSLELISGEALSRSQAANAGLDAARGDYIQFLDDDDWIAPQHISQLVSVLENDDSISAAYSSTQKTDSKGESLDYVFQESFDPILLMRDNYIPIHAILFESALLQKGCRFDEAFDIYEDWDFWLQLSQHASFLHVDTITAFYREGGDSDTAASDTRLRYNADTMLAQGRAKIFEKWLPKWTGEKVNALIGQLDQSVLLCEMDAKIHSELEKNAQLHGEVQKRDDQIGELNLAIDNVSKQLKELQENSTRHINTLEQRLDSIYSSTSWKLMGPVRRIGRALKAEEKSDSNDSDSDK